MANNITQNQKILLQDTFLQSGGESRSNFLDAALSDALFESAEKFVQVWSKVVKEKKIIASGNIESNLVILEPISKNGVVSIDIEIPYYAKFQDRGVKGLYKDPAPKSTYRFKTWGMSKEGEDSVRKWLETAKGKVSSSDAQKKQFGSETKFKKISDKDSTLRQAIAGIKAGGIKTRNFIDPIVEESFKDIGTKIATAYGSEVVIQIFFK
jgi:hypothetical protein